MVKNLRWIGLGGGLGALARYAMSGILPAHPVPYSIFLINIIGSFFIAAVMTLSLEFGWLSERLRVFLTVGVLGGFTTFSTFMLGTYELIHGQQLLDAYTYAVGSLLFGLLACWVGIIVTRALAKSVTGRPPEPEPPLDSMEDDLL